MTYLIAPVHSLVDGLRMKNRCYQKEGATLRHRGYFNRILLCMQHIIVCSEKDI